MIYVLDNLGHIIDELRLRLEPAFTSATAIAGSSGTVPSSGQCAAVALIINAILDGKFVSTRVDGVSHWFNRLSTTDGEVDVDLTGDQFGLPAVQIAPAGTLYEQTTVRDFSEVRNETLARAIVLARAANLADEYDLNWCGVKNSILSDVQQRGPYPSEMVSSVAHKHGIPEDTVRDCLAQMINAGEIVLAVDRRLAWQKHGKHEI